MSTADIIWYQTK